MLWCNGCCILYKIYYNAIHAKNMKKYLVELKNINKFARHGGVAGNGTLRQDIRKSVLGAWFWRSETSQLSNLCQNEATMNAYECVFRTSDDYGFVRSPRYRWLYILRGPLRCSFNRDGQCEGLRTWNGQQARHHAFSYINHLKQFVKDAARTYLQWKKFYCYLFVYGWRFRDSLVISAIPTTVKP